MRRRSPASGVGPAALVTRVTLSLTDCALLTSYLKKDNVGTLCGCESCVPPRRDRLWPCISNRIHLPSPHDCNGARDHRLGIHLVSRLATTPRAATWWVQNRPKLNRYSGTHENQQNTTEHEEQQTHNELPRDACE